MFCSSNHCTKLLGVFKSTSTKNSCILILAVDIVKVWWIVWSGCVAPYTQNSISSRRGQASRIWSTNTFVLIPTIFHCTRLPPFHRKEGINFSKFSTNDKKCLWFWTHSEPVFVVESLVLLNTKLGNGEPLSNKKLDHFMALDFWYGQTGGV